MGRFIVPAFITGGYHPGRQQTGDCLHRASSCKPTHEQLLLSDLLGSLIGSTRSPFYSFNPSSYPCRRGWSNGCPCGDLQNFRRPWIHTLDMSGFEQSDINVKVEADKILVHARHEERDGEDFSLAEKYRSVAIPEGVDKEKVACFLDDDGNVIIKGTYIPKRRCSTGEKKEKPKNDATVTSEMTAEKTCREVEVPVEVLEDQTASIGSSMTSNGTSDDEEVKQLDKMTLEGTIITDGGDSQKVENKTELKAEETEGTETDVEVTELPERSGSPMMSGEQADQETVHATSNDVEISEVGALAPLMDETQVVEGPDNVRQFQVRINLNNFKPGDISVRRQDNKLKIDARKEWNCEGIYTSQEVHRMYSLPPEACKDSDAEAKMSENGLLLVSVPMENMQKESKDLPDDQNSE